MSNNKISDTHENIVEWIRKLRFRKKLFGGVDEDDVLRKMAELNSLYESALIAERERYDALLKQIKGGGTDNE